MEEELPGAAQARAARRRADESRTDVREDSTAAKRDRVSQTPAGNLKKSHEHTGRGTEQRYAMIEELSVQFRIQECCVALSVSRSGYYQWAATEQSLRAEAYAELLKQIGRVYHEHKGRYGSPRISHSFAKRAWCVGRIGWRD